MFGNYPLRLTLTNETNNTSFIFVVLKNPFVAYTTSAKVWVWLEVVSACLFRYIAGAVVLVLRRYGSKAMALYNC